MFLKILILVNIALTTYQMFHIGLFWTVLSTAGQICVSFYLYILSTMGDDKQRYNYVNQQEKPMKENPKPSQKPKEKPKPPQKKYYYCSRCGDRLDYPGNCMGNCSNNGRGIFKMQGYDD